MDYLSKFPEETSRISVAECCRISAHISSHFQDNLNQLQISEDLSSQLQNIYIPLAACLVEKAKSLQVPLIVGINGAQGSGKSTLCALLETVLREGFYLRTISFSIDDLYYNRTERKEAAKRVHPLFATRGVPGTHDVKLGLELLSQLSEREPGHKVAIPVFDKSVDDRTPEEKWREDITPFDLVLFEGWCVGAKPQEESLLASPLNSLEIEEDPDGLWRSYVNQRLGNDYAELFAQLDILIMLQIPAMECVFKWRNLQERKLASQCDKTGATHIMSPAEIERFIMHYERLTLHMLTEMPERADLVLRLNHRHLIDEVRVNPGSLTKKGSA